MTAPGKSPLVSVILPAYNERENLVPLIQEVRAALAPRRVEVVVVDDNSPDGTALAVQEAFPGDEWVKVFVRPSDPSLAKSIRRGLEEAKGDVLVVMDSDFNHQPHYLPTLVDNLQYYECVIASRFLYGGRMNSRARHLLSWGFNVFVRASLPGGQITDNLYGFFAVRREILDRVPFDEVFWGYGDYFIRLLYYLQRHETSVLQIPAVNGERRAGEANSSFVGVFREYLHATLQLSLKERLRHVRGDRD
jgi:dolichol-phosphate mannosyltransferase